MLNLPELGKGHRKLALQIRDCTIDRRTCFLDGSENSLANTRPKGLTETAGNLDPKPVSAAQLLYAKKLAQGKGLIIPDDARTNSVAMSAWIDANRDKNRRKLN